MSSDGKKDVKDNVILKVVGGDETDTLQFSVKKHAPLGKIMRAYSKRVGKGIEYLRFRFDGEPLKETDTALSLGLEDGDAIDVFLPKVGG